MFIARCPTKNTSYIHRFLLPSTGSGESTSDSSRDSNHVGLADAAFALDEEVNVKLIAPRPPVYKPALVQVLQGAYPGTTIRRVRA